MQCTILPNTKLTSTFHKTGLIPLGTVSGGQLYCTDTEAEEDKEEKAQTQNPQIHSIIAIFILSNSIKVSDRENNECLYYFFRFLFPMLLILSFSFA